MATFSEALEGVRRGYRARRPHGEGPGGYVWMELVECDARKVDMAGAPESPTLAHPLLCTRTRGGRFAAYMPTYDDMFADDWTVMGPSLADVAERWQQARLTRLIHEPENSPSGPLRELIHAACAEIDDGREANAALLLDAFDLLVGRRIAAEGAAT